jgi:hypothetical protein
LHTLLTLYQITVKYTAATLSILIDGQISAKHMLLTLRTDYFGYLHA